MLFFFKYFEDLKEFFLYFCLHKKYVWFLNVLNSIIVKLVMALVDFSEIYGVCCLSRITGNCMSS